MSKDYCIENDLQRIAELNEIARIKGHNLLDKIESLEDEKNELLAIIKYSLKIWKNNHYPDDEDEEEIGENHPINIMRNILSNNNMLERVPKCVCVDKTDDGYFDLSCPVHDRKYRE